MRKLKILLLSALTLFSGLGVILGTLAWFQPSVEVPDYTVTGSSGGAYYAYGNGSEAKPYGIRTPKHLYNLAWLQYMGHYDDEVRYFELADGIPGDTLDMSGYVLPPIGSEQYPFYGVFNGRNKTISNITISGVQSELTSIPELPTGMSYIAPKILGFFGVVGALNDTPPTGYSSETTQMSNVTLDNIYIKSPASATQNETLVGLAAGYVDGLMSGVKVSGTASIDLNGTKQSVSEISSKTTKLTDYALVGYTTKVGSEGTYSQNLSAYYSNGSGSGSGGGDGQDWGGSIDMYNLYSRLLNIYDDYATPSGDYRVRNVTTYDENDTIIDTNSQTIESSGHFKNYTTDNADYSYTYNLHYNGSKNYMFLYGDVPSSVSSGTKAVDDISRKEQTFSGQQYLIKETETSTVYYIVNINGNTYNYLTVNGTSGTKNVSATGSTPPAEATQWSRKTVGSYYAFYVNIDGTTYYLYSGTNALLLRTTEGNYTRWSIRNNTIWCPYGSNKYVQFSNGTWGKSSSAPAAANGATVSETTDDKIYYLNATSTSNLQSGSVHITDWLYKNGKISTIINNTNYYLMGDSTHVYLSQYVSFENATYWNNSGSKLSYVFEGTTNYLTLSNYTVGIASTSPVVDMEETSILSETNAMETISNVTTSSPNATSGFPCAYFPLSTRNLFNTSSSNTGYIISGKQFVNPNYDSSGEAGYYNSGDIRISKYGMSKIETSLGQTTFDNSKLFVINATSNSDYALINDSFNDGNTPGSGLSSITRRKDANALNRYYDWEGVTGARTSIGNVFSEDSENIYGLHFMQASINSSNTVTIPNAKINGKVYNSGLTMPKDSIDFIVKENGYITFFAGTYFDNNSSFFSLHKIERDANNQISSLTEIRTIYKDNLNNFYFNPSSTSGLTKVFDTEVLTNPTTFIENAVYYFEIPVSAGEYALGSVSGKDGAYLMYLDISASGEQVLVDEVNAHFINTLRTGITYPFGVDFIPITVSGNGGDTICVAIAANNQGVIIFTIAAKDISVTDSSSIGTYSYRSDNYVASSPGDGEFTCNISGAPPSPSGGGTRVLDIGLETIGGDTYSIRITDVLSDDAGTIASSTYEVDSGSGYVSSTQAAIEALSSEIDISAFRNLDIVATLTRTLGTNEFVTTYDKENCSSDTIDVDIETNGTTISIEVETEYTFKIGGVAYADGSTYSA